MDDLPEHEVDWSVGQDLVGTSAKQTKFARRICDGLNQTQAAKAAGYRGEGSGLRGHAARLAKSNKVRALISWAKAGGAGPSDVPGDLKELKRILWKHARGSDKNFSIKSSEILHRLAAQERDLGIARADDGFEQERLARDLMMTNEDGVASFMLLLAGQRLALSCMPLLHDMAPKVQAEWPEIWTKLQARQSGVMLLDLKNKLADENYQRGTREMVWGERGWVIGRDNRAVPDPEGRAFISPSTSLPSIDETWNKPNGHASHDVGSETEVLAAP
jgi:hypothetical protein